MSKRSSLRFFSSPSGTDSVLAPWMTFSIPKGPFSASQRADELFGIVRVETQVHERHTSSAKSMNVIKVVVDLHHVEDSALKNM
jgi:hypothetical protein